MNSLARTNPLDRSDASKSKLFGLFALNRQIRLESSPRINDANNQLLQLDWDAFCYDIFKKPSDHFSIWQRLSQQILSLHRSRSIIVPSRSKQHFKAVLDAVQIDGKFERSFNVAMFLTTRALRIKGVSDDNIARTQSTLRKKQSQQTMDLQQATQAVKSIPAGLSSTITSIHSVRLRSLRQSIAPSAFLPVSGTEDHPGENIGNRARLLILPQRPCSSLATHRRVRLSIFEVCCSLHLHDGRTSHHSNLGNRNNYHLSTRKNFQISIMEK